MSFKPNSLYYSDGYKVGHKRMLAPNTTRLYGTAIPRNLKHAPPGVTKIVSFGQQLTVKWLHDNFTENFFGIAKEDAMQFPKDMSLYLGMDYDGKHFEDLYDLGYLPIKIKSLPEGIETLPNIPHMTFINTVKGFAWLTLYLETIISALSWKPQVAATIALQYKRNAVEWFNKTDRDNIGLIPYYMHDFSARGLNPHDMISVGLAHATSFRGSDTLITIPAARYYYNEPLDEVCVNSVNASEHSVSTTKIFTVGEKQMLKDWLRDFPKGILSIVADTFDIWKLITEYLVDLKEDILNRDGKLVIRGDSGDPVDIVCGKKFKEDKKYLKSVEDIDQYYRDGGAEYFDIGEDYYQDTHEETIKIDNKLYKVKVTAEINKFHDHNDNDHYCFDGIRSVEYQEIEYKPSYKGIVELLWGIFGGTVNSEGYKVLDSHVNTIYGDSINLERQVQMYERLETKGFAASNILLGVGSYTYSMITRDSTGYAIKGAWFEIEDTDGSKGYNIYKDPITDDGSKRSLKGFQAVYHENGEYIVKSECTEEEENTGILQTIYQDGKYYNEINLKEIREKLNN